MQPGDIVDVDGNILGHHNGVAFYTIGQRKGLNISHETPLYVVKLDIEHKQVIVGGADDVFANSLKAVEVHWIYPQEFPLRAKAKVRYGPRIANCVVEMISDDEIKVTFDEPQRAITAGQSIVFYDSDIVLGGGIIKEV